MVRSGKSQRSGSISLAKCCGLVQRKNQKCQQDSKDSNELAASRTEEDRKATYKITKGGFQVKKQSQQSNNQFYKQEPVVLSEGHIRPRY